MELVQIYNSFFSHLALIYGLAAYLPLLVTLVLKSTLNSTGVPRHQLAGLVTWNVDVSGTSYKISSKSAALGRWGVAL